MKLPFCIGILTLQFSCTTIVGDDLEARPDGVDNVSLESAIDCASWQDTGYVSGTPFTISVLSVDGKPVELATASSYAEMQAAAGRDGVYIQVVSGFRTWDEQAYLYDLYLSGEGNLAAPPGYSNHQSGHALDLNTGAPGVYDWLEANAWAYGFERTVPSEDWHWEYWGPIVDGMCAGGGEPEVPTPPDRCGQLRANEGLGPDTQLASCDGRFALVMQGYDGNLVLYQQDVGPIWSTETYNRGGHSLWLQGDGNLVLYARWGTPLWATSSFGDTVLELQDDGNLVLYGTDGPVWASDTSGR